MVDNFSLYRANDWIGFSTNGNITDAFICREMGDFLVLISGSHVGLSFIARGEHYRRGEGFSASYAGVGSELNGMLGVKINYKPGVCLSNRPLSFIMIVT